MPLGTAVVTDGSRDAHPHFISNGSPQWYTAQSKEKEKQNLLPSFKLKTLVNTQLRVLQTSIGTEI